MNPARPAPGTLIAPLGTLVEGQARAVDFVEGDAMFSLILGLKDGAPYAFENVCPHANAPMERPDGRVPIVEGRFLVCTTHGACFRIIDGACASGPAKSGLRRFPVLVKGEDVVCG